MGVDLTKNNRAAVRQMTAEGKFIPTELAIETIFGCNAKCIMCFIDNPTGRKKTVMSMDLFRFIIDEMEPYKEHVEKFDLWALGEPAIDPHLIERITYAREKGFRRMAIASNMERLDPPLATDLLESGIETIIISIDATTAETSEKIRRGLKFDKIMDNTHNLIEERDRCDYKTRFIVRYIIQEDINDHEWIDFRNYWQGVVSQARGDDVYAYKEHNWGGYEFKTAEGSGKVFNIPKKDLLGEQYSDEVERVPCHYAFESLIILADGSLALCPADFLEGQFELGKIPTQTPIEAFNSLAYKKMRSLHLDENKNDLSLCANCTLLYSNIQRDWTWYEGGRDGRVANSLTKRESVSDYMKPTLSQD